MTNSCKSCDGKIDRTKSNKGIACESCRNHFHVACIANLSSAFQQFLVNNDFKSWTCNQCKLNIRSLSEENERLKTANSQLVQENESLRRRLENLENQFSTFKTGLKQEILRELKSDSPPQPAIQSQSLNEQVLACIREEKDRERRRLNLCLRNLPETDSTSNDHAQVITLFTSTLGVNGNEVNGGIKNIKRVGTQSEDRPRIIIIECSNYDLKRKLLQNSFKLKNYNGPTNDKKVFLTPDMTKKQLEDDRNLRDELWSRRNNGESVFIRRGEIVSRPASAGSPPPIQRDRKQAPFSCST